MQPAVSSHQVFRFSYWGYQAAIYLVWPVLFKGAPQRIIVEITHPFLPASTYHVESQYSSVEGALSIGQCLFKHHVQTAHMTEDEP